MTMAVARSGMAVPAVAFVFAAIAVIKLALFVGLGPVSTPADTEYYVGYARLILASSDWLHDAGLTSAAVPPLAFHAAGYPIVLAAAMRLGGASWPDLVIALQFMLSFVAAWALYVATMQLGLSRGLALAGVAIYMLSFPLLFDQSLLSDSLHASLFVIAVCLLVGDIQSRHALRFTTAALAGLLLALAFLIREALQILVIALMPLLAVAAWSAGRTAWRRSVLACALVLLPLVVTVQAYEAWNVYRTGVRFVSTTAQFNMPLALEEVASSTPEIIAGDSAFDRAARDTFRYRDVFDDMLRFNDTMFRDGYLATDISRLGYEHYFAAWRRHPLAMLGLLRSHISEGAAKLTVRPIASICQTIELAARGPDPCYDYRDLTHDLRLQFSALPWTAPVTFAFETLERALAIALFSGFLLGAPVLLARRLAAAGDLDVPTAIVASFWLLYVIWFVGYGVVHLEDRFMTPVLPAAIVGGLYFWRHALALWRSGTRVAWRPVGSGRGLGGY
jgi:hypothetical protein